MYEISKLPTHFNLKIDDFCCKIIGNYLAFKLCS